MSKRQASLKERGKRINSSSSNANRAPLSSSNASTKVRTNVTAAKQSQGNIRSNATIRRLQMYRDKPDVKKMRQRPTNPNCMIEPGRKWFNNTRVVTQNKLQQFRDALEEKSKDPRSIVVKRTKLPFSLFTDSEGSKKRALNLLSIEPFEEVFSSNCKRKKPRLEVCDLEALARKAQEASQDYEENKFTKDESIIEEKDKRELKAPIEAVMLKGTSKRIWAELYKVVDSSDVIIQVLDARDPQGTRCTHLERHLKEDRPFKHMILLINKCDLVPTSVTDHWVRLLSKEYPTVAFKASMKHGFGKFALIGLLRQFAEIMKNRRHVSVGFIGYPNVGKSSVINTLKAKKVCNAAPVPGETKVWQYVALTDKVYLIDCPGIVSTSSKCDQTGKVLKGVVRAEKVDEPEQYIQSIIDKVGRSKMNGAYKLVDPEWTTAEEFLELVAVRQGKLKKGGEADIGTVARKIIRDFQRGKLPWFVAPPMASEKKPITKPESESKPSE